MAGDERARKILEGFKLYLFMFSFRFQDKLLTLIAGGESSSILNIAGVVIFSSGDLFLETLLFFY